MAQKTTKSGYWYVSLPNLNDVNRHKRSPISHSNFDKERLSGEIICTLKTKTPMHIGSGIYELGKEDVGYPNYDGAVKAMVKEDGFPIIPGSSLKGAFRSITEAISYSCTLSPKGDVFRSCSIRDNNDICVCCNIFGAMGFMGRVRFSKATLVDKADYQNKKPKTPKMLAALNEPKKKLKARKFYLSIDYLSKSFWASGSAGDYYVTVKKGYRNENGHFIIKERYDNRESLRNGKFVEPYEYVPEDIEFEFTISFENLTKAEIGLVLIGMGLNQENGVEFYPRLGGAKPLCFGVVEVKAKDFVIRNCSEDFSHFDISSNSKDINEWLRETMQEAQKSSDMFYKSGYDQLKNILKYPAETPETVDWKDVFAKFGESKKEKHR